jgi:hypothetical protein
MHRVGHARERRRRDAWTDQPQSVRFPSRLIVRGGTVKKSPVRSAREGHLPMAARNPSVRQAPRFAAIVLEAEAG